MQEWREIITRLGALLLLASCAIWCLGGCNRLKAPSSPHDVIDNDFLATITPTNDPTTFVVKVEKINPKPQKELIEQMTWINITIKTVAGTVISKSLSGYIQNLGRVSSGGEYTTSLVAKFHIVQGKLSPGSYILEPKVRAVESGKDALSSMLQDGGSVAIPAHNTLTITIK